MNVGKLYFVCPIHAAGSAFVPPAAYFRSQYGARVDALFEKACGAIPSDAKAHFRIRCGIR